MNKKYILIALLCFVILGAYLRFNHIDFPSISLHNMKQNEYLAEAKLMLSNPDVCLWHRCTYLFWGLEPGNFGENGSGYFEEYTQLPILSYMTAFGWKIAGSEPIWLPRLIVILFSLGSIIVMYLIVKRLTDNEYISLLSAFLFTVMPVGIYFGSQGIQPDMSALFFTMLAIYFYLKWIKLFENKNLIFSMFAVSMAGLFKETFLIILIPLAFITPWKQIKKSHIGCAALGLLPFILLQGFYELLVVNRDKILSESIKISFGRLIDSQYWVSTLPMLYSTISDNFTWWFFFITILGVLLALVKPKNLTSRLIIGYAVSLIPFCGILSGKLGGQGYYQLAYLPLVCMASAFFLFNIGNIIKQMVNIKYIEYISLILIICAAPSMIAANDRMFGTAFFGQDLAGEYIKAHTAPDERFFIYGHSQTFATCTYAQRRCGQPYKNNISIQSMEGNANYTIAENPYNISYLTFDQYGLYLLQTEYAKDWEYIQNNYRLVWVGAIPQNQGLVPYIYILKRGGKFNAADMETSRPYLAKTYKMSYGDVPFYVEDLT